MNILYIARYAAVVIAFGVALGGCTDDDGAFHTLAMAGYTNITITGSVWFSGCLSEPYQTGFVAINSNKAVVRGVICKQGWPSESSLIRTYS
jgi:hypothetical protein